MDNPRRSPWLLAPEPPHAPSVKQAVLACLLINLVPTAVSLLVRSYDAETHLFFADHYRRGWFDGWEPRWYGGFFVYSYPPLFHQLVALVGAVTDLETAYCIVQLIVLAAVPLSIWLLTRAAAADGEAAGWAAALSVSTAGVYTTVYTFGQLPTLASLVLVMAAAAFFIRYLERGAIVDLLAWTGLAGASIAAHSLTGIVGLPMICSTCLLMLALRPAASRPPARSLGRLLIASIALAAVAAAVLAPFFWWMTHWRVSQAEIPHPTRANVFENARTRFLFVDGLWGAAPLAALPVLWICLRRREMLAWALLVGVLGVLSLGPRFSSLPALLFPNWSYWLTYDRFALWGAVLILLPFGLWMAQLRSQALIMAVFLLFASYAVPAAVYNAKEEVVSGLADRNALVHVAHFLDGNGRDAWRYMSLGLAEADMPHLSRLTDAQTIDGTYFTARSDPFLSRSGLSLVDTAQWQRPGMVSYARFILSHPQDYHLRWAVSAAPMSARLLQEMGWKCIGTVSGVGLVPVVKGEAEPLLGVTLWRAPARMHVPPLPQRPPPDEPPLLRILWGCAPLSLLILGIGAALASLRRTEVAC